MAETSRKNYPPKTKLLPTKVEREMKQVAEAKGEPVLGIEQVVGVAIVPVEPETVLIVFDVEDVQVAVRIADYIRRLLKPPYKYLKRAYVVFGITFLALASYTK